jgi:hypothetical protein
MLATAAPASIDSIGAASAGEAVRTRVPARKQAGPRSSLLALHEKLGRSFNDSCLKPPALIRKLRQLALGVDKRDEL